MTRKRLYWEKKILKVADIMINKGWTLLEIEKYKAIPHTTAHRYITKYLSSIDTERYNKCIDIIEYHKRVHKKGWHRG